MNIKHNISLKPYNTFGVDVLAERFVSITSYFELQQLLKKEKNLFLISGGSNLLLTKDIKKLVVHINIKGISIDKEVDGYVYITVNAGENWHDFVLWCISQNYGGIENLSLIPGNVGTCPIQNVGAYGVEVKDVITKIEAVDIETTKKITLSNKDCEFNYRNSIFKNKLKGKVIITSVGFKLTTSNHKITTAYGTIETELQKKGYLHPTIKNISDAVIAIRQSKLPDPNKIGNSGSFFKNPVITENIFKVLKQQYPNVPSYNVGKDFKIPAGWLVEQAGFKGKQFGNVGVHKKQALVLVNYGNGTGKEIFELAQKIQQKVLKKFNIALEIEVNIID